MQQIAWPCPSHTTKLSINFVSTTMSDSVYKYTIHRKKFQTKQIARRNCKATNKRINGERARKGAGQTETWKRVRVNEGQIIYRHVAWYSLHCPCSWCCHVSWHWCVAVAIVRELMHFNLKQRLKKKNRAPIFWFEIDERQLFLWKDNKQTTPHHKFKLNN